MNTEYKYKDWQELIAAFKSGELDGWMISMDNDCAGLQWVGESPNEPEFSREECEAFQDRKREESQKLWRGGGYADIVDLLQACGIPADWC